MAELRADLTLSVDQALRQVERLRQEASRALTIDVDVPPVDLGLGDDLASVQSLDDGLADVTEGIGDATSASDKLGGALRGALAVVGAREIIRGLVALADAASDLEESSSKASVVFADSFGQVADFAEDAAVNIGLSEAAAFEAAGTFGNLFVAQGFAAEASADMSTNILQLGADLASFNNLEVDETLDKIRSGLVGEIEPLRQLGVSFNAAQVEAKAFELGLADASGAIDDGAKIQARYQLILEQTATAQGDFARTSGGLANQQRILSAEWQNAAAQLGKALLPSALDLVDLLREDLLPASIELGEAGLPILVEAFEALSPALGSTTDILVAFAPLLELVGDVLKIIPAPVLTAVGAFVSLNRALRTSSILTAPGGRGLTARFLALSAAVGAFSDAFGLAPDVERDARLMQDAVESLLEGDFDSGPLDQVVAALDAIADPSLSDNVGTGISRIVGAFGGVLGVEGTTAELERALDNFDVALSTLVTSGNVDTVRRQLSELIGLVPGLTFEEAISQLPLLEAALESAEVDVGAFGDEIDGAAAATDAATTSLQEYAEALLGLDPVFAFTQAQQDLTDALESFREGGPATAEEAEAVVAALARVVALAGETGEALGEGLPPELEVVAASLGVTSEELAVMTGFLIDARGAARELAGTVADVQVTVDGRNADQAFKDLTRELEKLSAGEFDLPLSLAEAAIELEQYERMLDRIENDDIEIRVDQAEILAAERAIRKLKGERVDLPIVVSQTSILSAERRIDQLRGETVFIDVDAVTRKARDEINRLIRDVDGTDVFFIPGGGRIPAAASGLIAEPRRGGHLVRVAEAGVREVIIPVDDAARARTLADASGLSGLLADGRGGGNNINVSVVGAVDPDVVATKTADELALVMLRAGG